MTIYVVFLPFSSNPISLLVMNTEASVLFFIVQMLASKTLRSTS